jgi:hypothetical protein
MKCIGLAHRDHSFGSVVVFPPSNMSAISAQALTAGEERSFLTTKASHQVDDGNPALLRTERCGHLL